MPSGLSATQIELHAANTAATEGVKATFGGRATRIWHSLVYKDTTLTNKNDIIVFNYLFRELAPFCSDADTNPLLPLRVVDCWQGFRFDELRGNVYLFKSVADLKLLKDSYLSGTPIDGHVCRDFPLTGAVLSTLAAIKSIQVDSKQTIAKVALGYIGSVALQLPDIDCAVQQYDVVTHMKRVTTILIHDEKFRLSFDKPALNALRQLTAHFQNFLSTPHPMRDAEFIPRAVHQFAKHQVELVSQLFKVLLSLSEGGNKAALTADYLKISKGILEDGGKPKSFHEKNPFQDLLKYVATFIPDLHQQYSRELDLIGLELPSPEDVETYLALSLECGVRLRGHRGAHGNDSVLYLLEQKKVENSTEVVWLEPTDKKSIQLSAAILIKLANWLRFHIYIADKIVNLKFLLSIDGQRWLAQGEEASFIQRFITKYHELLLQFKKEIDEINHYLNQRVRTNMSAEHGVLKSTGILIGNILTQLLVSGVQPLLNIEDRFMTLARKVPAIRQSFFADAGRFLNSSGYGFQLPEIGVSNHASPPYSPLLAMEDAQQTPILQAAAIDSVQDTNDKKKLERKNGVSRKLDAIRELYINYAQEHGYQVDLSGEDEPILTTKSGARHEARAKWIQECLMILNSTDIEEKVLGRLKKKIDRLKTTATYKEHFIKRIGKTGIQICIESVDANLINIPPTAAGALIPSREVEIDEEMRPVPSLSAAPINVMLPISSQPPTMSVPMNKEEWADVYSSDGEEEVNALTETNAEEEPTIKSAVVDEIRRWVAGYIGPNIGEVERKSFLKFWEKLCLITKISSMEKYHRLLSSRHQSSEVMEFYQQVKSGLISDNPDLKRWATAVLTDISGLDGEDKLNALIELARSQLIVLQKKVATEKERYFGLHAAPNIAWSLSLYEELGNNIDRLNMNEPGLTRVRLPDSMDARIFLDSISHRLLQDAKSSREENKAFDEYLKEIFSLYAQASNENEKSFIKKIIQGLFLLGANPLPWMDEQIQVGARIQVSKEASPAYFLAAEQAKFIISHLMHQASHLGDSLADLNSKLNELFSAVEAFADRLHSCVKSDNDLLWRGLSLFGVESPEGARYERAAIYWAALKWIYVILNEELLDKTAVDNESAAVINARDLFSQAKNRYNTAVPEKKKLYNMGTASFEKLTIAVEAVVREINHLGTRRLNRTLAIRQQKSEDKNTVSEGRMTEAEKNMQLHKRRAEGERREKEEVKIGLMNAMRLTISDNLPELFGPNQINSFKKADRQQVFDRRFTKIVSRTHRLVPLIDIEIIKAEIRLLLTTLPQYAHVAQLAQTYQEPANSAASARVTNVSMFQPASPSSNLSAPLLQNTRSQ